MSKIVLLFCFLISFGVRSQTSFLESGLPIRNEDKKGYGRMSLPFYNGYLMGLAAVQSERPIDLFLQGTNGSLGVIYYYAFKKFSDDGIPVYENPLEIDAPYDGKNKERGVVFQHSNGIIYGFWKYGKTIRYAEFDKSSMTFTPKGEINVVGAGFSDFGIVELPDKRLLFLAGRREEGIFSNGAPHPHKIAYNAEGFWPYEIPRMGVLAGVMNQIEDKEVKIEQFTSLDQVYYAFEGFVGTEIEDKFYIVSGTRLGNIQGYEWNRKTNKLDVKRYVVDPDNIIQRNPNVHAYVGYFKYDDTHQGIFTVGEGGIYYYASQNKINDKGNLVFGKPQHLLQLNPDLYAGSLVNPQVVDWNNDGALDLIVGNSMGFIFYFQNEGTNENPRYGDPAYLKANNEIIHIQPGYREDIQGPGEARWGYVSPTVFDWDGDGKLDILTGDSRGKFMFYKNIGTADKPILAFEKPLYLEGMDLYGTWRVKPGVARFGDKVAYIIFDRDDELHLYWQLDTYNVADGGKLMIADKPIRGNKFGGGTVGRGKIEIVDWDEDGVHDLLIGTYGKQSIPDTSSRSLPINMKPKRGSTVLFLKNVGTNEKPAYDFPKVLKHNGVNISLGGHSCTPSVGNIGGNHHNLVIGVETGRIIFYNRENLSY
ncbi:VCBS repeat-containing protein [Sphingobacterium phlebotomi]|uniref:VCBS repeat-containing protein n=1 Tax=Sphingobacterium phlebotomi TaxID=2605433 RepID=A0A5D4HA96_9SPHI|nr:VCBS repeat-containing protein [Sphingobacterium phlebotomi]TYR37534.1 VCBS repeat-containing protein [Sphingobacterium phlebotomi]